MRVVAKGELSVTVKCPERAFIRTPRSSEELQSTRARSSGATLPDDSCQLLILFFQLLRKRSNTLLFVNIRLFTKTLRSYSQALTKHSHTSLPKLNPLYPPYLRTPNEMASKVYLTMGEKTVMVSRPATHQDLLGAIRFHFPHAASVYSIAVLVQPAAEGSLREKWVEVAPSAYGHVHDGAELFVNVRRTDGYGNRVGDELGDRNYTAEDDQVSRTRSRGVSSGPRGAWQPFDKSSLSLELERPGGDVFTSGWGGASERFRRSSKLVPNLKDCKEAVGRTVGQSDFYPEEEEEEVADSQLGKYQGQGQHQGQPATEAGWYAGGEPAQMGQYPGQTEAQHLAGGLIEDQYEAQYEAQYEDQHEGEQAPRFHSDDSNRNWFAVPHSPQNFLGTLPQENLRDPMMFITPQRGHYSTDGQARDGYRPSPGEWLPGHGGHNLPEYVRSRSSSPVDAGDWNQEGNRDGWNDEIADQEFSRPVPGPSHHPEGGHLTDGVLTDGVTTNGNLTNGEVSQYSQHQDQHYGSSEWSPPRHQSRVLHRPQDLQFRGYLARKPGPKAFAGSRLRRDPAEVTYGSPRPRIQGSNSDLTTIGRKKNTRTDIPFQEESDPERAQPHGNANDQA